MDRDCYNCIVMERKKENILITCIISVFQSLGMWIFLGCDPLSLWAVSLQVMLWSYVTNHQSQFYICRYLWCGHAVILCVVKTAAVASILHYHHKGCVQVESCCVGHLRFGSTLGPAYNHCGYTYKIETNRQGSSEEWKRERTHDC